MPPNSAPGLSDRQLPARRGRLRVALLLDSFQQPAWVAALIDDIVTSDVARIELVVRNASTTSAMAAKESPVERVRRWIRNRGIVLFALYDRLDRRKFRVADDPFRLVDVSAALGAIPVIDVTPRKTRFSDYFEDSDVERVRGFELDVAVRLGFGILRGRALDIARFGVWSYHHGDNLKIGRAHV